jgi:hypothetical protein
MHANNTPRERGSQSPKTTWRDSRWSANRLIDGKWVLEEDVDPPVFPRDVGPINEVKVSDGSGRIIAVMWRALP